MKIPSPSASTRSCSPSWILTLPPLATRNSNSGCQWSGTFLTEVSGDFVLKVKVSHAFRDTYDSATVMIMKDFDVWAKSCFEKTDFGTHAVVSVGLVAQAPTGNGGERRFEGFSLEHRTVENIRFGE